MVDLTLHRFDGGAISAGCMGCIHRPMCGGWMRNGGGWNCLDVCCGKPSTCDVVCPRRPDEFTLDVLEVRGFTLDNVGALSSSTVDLPRYVPVIHDGTGRSEPLVTPWAALPLQRVCSRRDRPQYGVRFDSKADTLGQFQLGVGSKLLLLCIGKDRHLELYWSEKNNGTHAELALAGFDAAVAPNFSWFLDDVRFQHMYNRKRSLICASEFAVAGIQPIIYLHALSVGDWRILADFLRSRPDVTMVAKEFQTGGVQADHRGKIQHVADLEQRIGRQLHFVAVGGARFVPELQRYLSAWTVVDSIPYMRTLKGRKRAFAHPSRVKRLRWESDHETPLNELLAHNIGEYKLWIDRFSEAQARVA
jgi:hypothetical protein